LCFGHGYLISWSDYDYLWEHLAPAGFVVALPTTGGELFPNHLEFGQDIAFVSRALRAEDTDPTSLFYGVLSDAAALGGHSMGGGASFLGTASDSTVTALFNLAAAETDPSAIAAAAGIEVPALLFSGSADCVAPSADHQIPMYDALASWCKTHVTFEGASHCQFAESNFFCNLGEGGCPVPTMTRNEQHDLTLAVLTPYLRAVLEDDWASWADFQTLIDSLSCATYVQDCAGAGLDPVDQFPQAEQGPLISLTAFPNPSRGTVSLRFALCRSAHVAIDVVSPEGKLVDRIADGGLSAGIQNFTWDARNSSGSEPAPGVYFYRVSVDGASYSGRLLIIR
jgi:hypothetical protein